MDVALIEVRSAVMAVSHQLGFREPQEEILPQRLAVRDTCPSRVDAA